MIKKDKTDNTIYKQMKRDKKKQKDREYISVPLFVKPENLKIKTKSDEK